MHGQITLTEWISLGDVYHMAESWLYARSNHILEDAILIIQGVFNQLSVDQCYHFLSPPPQATEQAETLKEQRRREERENLAELLHTLTSDMMTECAEAAKKEVGGGRPPRVLIDRWKGMSPEQLSAIHREREEQRLQGQVLVSLYKRQCSFHTHTRLSLCSTSALPFLQNSFQTHNMDVKGTICRNLSFKCSKIN